MKSLVCLILALLGATHAHYPLWTYTHAGPYGYTSEIPCNNILTNELVIGFRQALYETIGAIVRKTAALSDAHFTISPLTIWKALAAIAEGSEGKTRDELYRFLRLPEDKCVRQLYYHLASSREAFSHDVILERNQLFIVDSSVILNRNWENYVKSHKLIDVAQIPFKSNHVAEIESWKQTFDAQFPKLGLNGNSLILESLDYNGLWTSAFSDVTVVREPFYNAFGAPIASLEYMKMKKRVKMAFIPSLNMKILELPVGKGGRYRMLFGLILGNTRFRETLDIIQGSVLFEALSKFKKSSVPIEVVLPRVTMTSETDVRKVLEQIGVSGMWVDPYATRNISEPAALPSSFIQRVSVTLESNGVRPSIEEFSNLIPAVQCEPSPHLSNATGLDPVLGQDFTANRPFLFGLFDTETYMCLFASSFSKPSY